MKNKLFIGSALTLAVMTFFGCMTFEKERSVINTGNFGENTRTPVKDYESLGLVFIEGTLSNGSSTGNAGRAFTYQALLKEAQKLNADAIINVVIDEDIDFSSFPSKQVTTWYGSALAIKYTNTLMETGNITVTSGETVTNTVTTSVYLNEGGAPSAETPPAPAGGTAGLTGEQAAPAKGLRQ